MAFGFVLVASIFRVPFGPGPGRHSAFLMVTLSAAGGVPGATVTVVVAVLPNHVAVIVAVVVRGGHARGGDLEGVARPPWLTTICWGTCTTAGLLLASVTTAPSFIGPVKLTVPVALLPPMIRAGVADTSGPCRRLRAPGHQRFAAWVNPPCVGVTRITRPARDPLVHGRARPEEGTTHGNG